MKNLYCLFDLAELVCSPQKSETRNYVRWKNQSWKVLPQTFSNHMAITLLKANIPGVLVMERTDLGDPSKFLAVFLDCDAEGPQFFSSIKEKLIRTCFTFHHPPIPMETTEQLQNNFLLLYLKLKEAHAAVGENENTPELGALQLPHMLRPVLRPYQLRAVRWMLRRERTEDTIPTESIELRSERFPGQEFHMERHNWKVWDRVPSPKEIPKGGLLCDEMGLGKTVEILSLILHNPNPKFIHDSDFKRPLDPVIETVKGAKKKVQCICSRPMARAEVVECQSCKTFQHKRCVLKHSKWTSEILYRCPGCWYKSQEVVESKATIIVSPQSISRQWLSEIQKHVCDPEFRVLVYTGVKTCGWISPLELAQYDVVLTDYNVLNSEIYFAKVSHRSLRYERQHTNPVSPLPMVLWWRSCLDEAQMVESVNSQCAQMVNSLPAVHRWAVTGTPIEKKVSSLFGLIYFIGFEPYNNFSVFSDLIQRYENGSHEPLMNILKRVMWRTNKADVLDEIGVPPQTEKIHYVVLSDLQMFFYRNEHAQYRSIFLKKSEGLIRSSVAGMASYRLKLLMDPLRKLRQDCIVPSINSKNGMYDQTNKKFLTPAQLHDHLVKNTENECKINLRTIASSVNGVAGCYILKKMYPEAIKSYESILKLREEEVQGKKIGVDTLLQYHAIFNLLDISPQHPNISDLQELLKELEVKFIEAYYLRVKEVHDRLVQAKKEMHQIDGSLAVRGNAWWKVVLYDCPESTIVEKILCDLRDIGFSQDFQTARMIDFVLTTWLDDLDPTRKSIVKKFDDLEYFSANIRARHTLTEDELFKHSYLIETAFNCHLDIPPEDSDAEQQKTPTKSKKNKCQLCRVKSELNQYECKLFNKHIVIDPATEIENVVGTWSSCYQEVILKTLLGIAKREKFYAELVEEGETCMKLLEATKDEFKEYSQYWVEINYSAGAYDELNMCKSRLQAFDLMDVVHDEGRGSNMRIPWPMIDSVLQEFLNERKDSEIALVRNKGRLRYLIHLKQGDSELDSCPICKQTPEDKYAVLQCGHLLCFHCVIQMAKYQRNRLLCAVCRHEQHFKDVLYVSCNSQTTIVQGSFSTKIIQIIQTVLEIKSKEPDVKIVIFSQWENILNVIEAALKQNNISFASKKNSKQFHECLEDFKNISKGVTCLLLALAAGSKGLNLVEATHVFLVEPILDPSEEKQAIGRVHRIGQTRPTFVHRFIVQNTIEEKIFNTCSTWNFKNATIEDLKALFDLEDERESPEHARDELIEID